MTLAVALTTLVAGVLMGLTGIGGVLVVPALTEFGAVPVDRAVAASMMGFIAAGILAAAFHVRRAGLGRRRLAALCAAAAVGAAAGSASLDFLPASAVRLFIACLALASGLDALLRSRATPEGGVPRSGVLALLGLAAGYGSAVSGTGGPVILIPVLVALRTPFPAAIGLGIAAGIPIILTATAVNAAASRIDFALAGWLAVVFLAGTIAGNAAYARLSGRAATTIVAWSLVAVGIWYGYVTLHDKW